jgi:hypothetical protein
VDTPIKRHNKDVLVFYYIVVLHCMGHIEVYYFIFVDDPRPIVATDVVIGCTIADVSRVVWRQHNDIQTFFYYYIYLFGHR